MDSLEAGSVTPIFLAGTARRIFGLYHAPAKHARRRGALIYVPPFAEEMNRARRVAALQARALATVGVGVLLVDLFGTGDSAGDFRDARWQTWSDDLSAAADWMERLGNTVTGFWGL